jgi:hypothetical protein
MNIFPGPQLSSTQLGGYYLSFPFTMTDCAVLETANPTPVTVFVVGAFKRVWVSNVYVGGTVRVNWEMERAFADPGPYSFQLQWSHSGTPRGDDWTDVGSPTTSFFADDTKGTNGQRMFGKTATVYYRVALTTDLGCYVSPIAGVLGTWTKYDWLLAREILRQEQLNHKIFSSVKGYLLKARRYGVRCNDCRDSLDGEIIDSTCGICYGTGFVNGYYPPTEYYGLLDTTSPSRESRSLAQDGSTPGIGKRVVNTGRFLAVLPMIQADAWVDANSDERYYVHTVREAASWKSVPLVYNIELRLAPFSDALYLVPVP